MTETPSPHVIDADTLSGGLKPIRQVILSLGSNLGDREANLQGAVDALRDTPDVVVVDVSPVYETEPIGGPDESGPYLNIVLLADTTLAVETLLDRAHAVEQAFGRERSVKGAPRTLDVDLITYGKKEISTDELTVPHPRAHERAFVLAPWLDIESDAVLPGVGPVADLLAKVGTDGVKRLDDLTIEAQ
ncbi:2-amino-4-hydroxy-6-hydroxymethyldihydropteridine diphosphokinase [Kribbella voronezhensis]|uniref:2-amino-4-hydroxy-6-hydroxymethyldihydropteridine diphosphokinase n=1 Tax=Kribbella voronezhensis TaxID=2512212 RepID=A0A4R7TGC0_9ACTN|nr:2-amino-4-hydroxy-6-hydroxymethyldihydropteridine diphosphokinase [Kribbella voronezhensis]TDU90538.1 2-amino-4-hydroxy-6-hydroxymethyldihydropteridine diphosphokinase [Kribbella voronezhensis]